jgi:hypothetical protein
MNENEGNPMRQTYVQVNNPILTPATQNSTYTG